jgi:serine O-acetyltransferase
LLAIPFVLLVGATAWVARYPAHTRLILAVVTVTMLIRFLAAPISSGLQAFQKMHINAIGDVITNGLFSFAGVALVMLFRGGMVSIALVSLAATLVVLSVEGWALSRVAQLRVRFDGQLIRHMIVGSLPYWISGLVLTFYVWVDSVLLSIFTSSRVVGWYGASTNLFSALLFIPTILSTALLPALAHAHQHDPAELRLLMRRCFTLITALSVPLAVGTALLAPNIVHLIYGGAYAPSGTILVVLGLTLVPTYVNILAGTFLVSTDRQVLWTRVMVGACLVNPLINVVAINYFQARTGNGGLGAAVALLATEALMACAGLWLVPRDLLGASTRRSLGRSAVAAVVMGVVVWPLRGHFVLVPLIVGGCIYAALALALGAYPREDLGLLMPLVAKVTRRLGLGGRPLAGDLAGMAGALQRRTYSAPELIVADVRAWKRMGYLGPSDGSDLTWKDAAKLLWQSPGLRATLTYRLSAEAKRLGIPMVPGVLARRNVRRYGLDIVPSVSIGPGLYIPHPVGTVIMARAIGRDCQIISGVTIGMRGPQDFATIGDGVFIGAGARVLGAICIGDGAQIGANAVVLRDVPAGATAVGVPARLLPRALSESPDADEPTGRLAAQVQANGHAASWAYEAVPESAYILAAQELGSASER